MSHLKWIIPLLILTLVIVPAPTQANELEASIEVLEGGVEVMQNGTKKWTTLSTDAFVSTGDRVRTDDEGIALITWFEDGTFMELQPNSEMFIEEFSGDEETFMMDATLFRGSLFNSVRRLLDTNARYQINTPSQTATVRGTVFAVNVDDMDTTAIVVLEGTVNAGHLEDAEDVEDAEFFAPVETGNMIIVSVADGLTTDSEAISLEDAPEEYTELIEGLTTFFDKLNEDFGTIDASDTDANNANNGNNGNNGVGNGEGGGIEGNRGKDDDHSSGQSGNSGGNGGNPNK